MNFHIKAFIAVMAITFVMFVLARPLFLRIMSQQDFALRRNAWLLLNFAAFASFNYWLFIVVAIPIIYFTMRKDSNPTALYAFLLMALPPVQVDLPTAGILNQLFILDYLRLLSLTLLLPVGLTLINKKREVEKLVNIRKAGALSKTPDILVLTYAALQLLVLIPYESPTHTMRRSLLIFLDFLLPYFVLSRACENRKMLQEAMASLGLAAIVLAPLALLEMFWNSMLFSPLETAWGGSMMYLPLMRGDLMRAQVTAGHSIVFGFAIAVALSLWFGVKHRITNRTMSSLAWLCIIVSLVASLSRGPWIGAIAGSLFALAAGPGGARKTFKSIGILFGVAAGIMASPLGNSIIEYMPFIGTSDDSSVIYRQQLFDVSINIIAQNPLFGMPSFIQHMESLRQGQGIIDLVNGHLTIALSQGLVGLGLFYALFGTISYRALKEAARAGSAEDYRALAAGLVGGIIAAMVTFATASYYLAVPYIFWALAAFGASLLRSSAFQAIEPVQATAAARGRVSAQRPARVHRSA